MPRKVTAFASLLDELPGVRLTQHHGSRRRRAGAVAGVLEDRGETARSQAPFTVTRLMRSGSSPERFGPSSVVRIAS
jgi:hypothetical protein